MKTLEIEQTSKPGDYRTIVFVSNSRQEQCRNPKIQKQVGTNIKKKKKLSKQDFMTGQLTSYPE